MRANQANSNSGLFSGCAMLGLALLASPSLHQPMAWAKDEPASSPSGSPESPSPWSDSEFLALPSYDLEIENARDPRSHQNNGIRVGDQVEVKISGVSLPRGVAPSSVTLAVPPGSAPLDEQGFAIEKVTPTALNSQGQGGAANLTAVLVPVKPGKLSLTSLGIVSSSGAIRPIARTNPFSLEVVSSIAPTDPKPHEPEPVRPPLMIDFPTWVLILVGLVVLCILVAAFYALYRWSQKQRPWRAMKPGGPPLSEDETAMIALSELEKSAWFRSGENKKHAFRISEILKIYIGARFKFDALECTTRELFAQLNAHELGRGQIPQKDTLKNLFDGLDRVKFTDYRPELDEALLFLADARRFVQATRRPPSVSDSGAK